MRLLAVCLLLCTGCGVAGPLVSGSGTITTDSRELGPFDRVSMAGHADLTIEASADGHACDVTCDDNLQEFIETRVVDGTLEIKQRHNVRLSPTDGIRVRLALPNLKAVELAGASRTEITGLSEAGSLSLEAAGSHEIICQGKLDSLDVELAGSGKVLAQEAEVRNLDLSIAGSGSAEVHAVDTLKVSIAGSGKVRYLGEPKVTQSIVGAGSIEKAQP